ncbi:hypothetical protein BJV78DRAFT_1116484 [Lactifluus subvellereus]|nr:hypothetical protein BJV78DRAFT_1116484 [Lactifluus subvellereus]
MSRPPKNWPTQVQYLTVPCFHSSISSDALSFLTGFPKGTSLQLLPRAPPSLGVIRPIVDHSHPAHGQRGLFAARKIPARTLIVEYIGEVHSDERPTSDYDVSLFRFPHESVGVDASRMGNEARFVNDYRGIRLKPNAEFVDQRTAGGDLRMGIWSLAEGIRKGDEIVVSYGKAWWTAR